MVQHFHAYGLIREEGLALSRRLVETNTVYDLPAANSIEDQLKAWDQGAAHLLAEVKASGEAEALRPRTAELFDTL